MQKTVPKKEDIQKREQHVSDIVADILKRTGSTMLHFFATFTSFFCTGFELLCLVPTWRHVGVYVPHHDSLFTQNGEKVIKTHTLLMTTHS